MWRPPEWQPLFCPRTELWKLRNELTPQVVKGASNQTTHYCLLPSSLGLAPPSLTTKKDPKSKKKSSKAAQVVKGASNQTPTKLLTTASFLLRLRPSLTTKKDQKRKTKSELILAILGLPKMALFNIQYKLAPDIPKKQHQEPKSDLEK